MILGVIALHLFALHALLDTRRQPLALPVELRRSMTVLDPVALPPSPVPAPAIEPVAAPSPTSEMRRSPRFNTAPARSTAARPIDRSTGMSALPEAAPAAPAASDVEPRRPLQASPPLLDPAATARAIADIARHPQLPGSAREAPMNFGDKLARDLGSDDHTTEEHLDNGVLRIRSGNKCLLSSPSRTADPFTQANAPTPRLTTTCD